jgi:hypothetical protein
MFEGFERRAVDLDGIKIVCVVGGSGPPVLLLHGFPQNKSMWARVAPQLASNFTVVCADLRGYGDSAKPNCLPDRSNYAFRAFANDQIGLMRNLGERQCDAHEKMLPGREKLHYSVSGLGLKAQIDLFGFGVGPSVSEIIAGYGIPCTMSERSKGALERQPE